MLDTHNFFPLPPTALFSFLLHISLSNQAQGSDFCPSLAFCHTPSPRPHLRPIYQSVIPAARHPTPTHPYLPPAVVTATLLITVS